MGTRRIYLDHNATTPLRDEARAAVIAAMSAPGNPSSIHTEGRAAHKLIERARADVAAYLGAQAREIVFTSGATEANNWVIRQPWTAVITSAVEHDSVRSPAAQVECPHHIVAVDKDGIIDLDALAAALATKLERAEPDAADAAAAKPRRDAAKVLVSIQAANAETGVVQKLKAVREIVDQYPGALFHVDAVQLRPCHRDLMQTAKADFASMSGHKMGGPTGVGALVVKDGLALIPLIFGGGQEGRRRSGTQNVAGIAGFGAAAKAAATDDAREQADAIGAMRDTIEQGVRAATPSAFIPGANIDRLTNTSCICVPNVRAETLVMALDLEGLAVSAGSACSSGKVTTSHVLSAMGLPADLATSAIRVSLGWSTTQNDIDQFLDAWNSVMSRVLARQSANATTTTTESRQIA